MEDNKTIDFIDSSDLPNVLCVKILDNSNCEINSIISLWDFLPLNCHNISQHEHQPAITKCKV